MPPSWCAEFVGVPYAKLGRSWGRGLDCWGLVIHVLARRFGVEADGHGHLAYEGRRASPGLAEAIRDIATQGPWRLAAGQMRPGDVLLLRVDGHPCHVGVVAEFPWFIHTEVAHDSVLADVTGLTWSGRVVGVYRHERLSED